MLKIPNRAKFIFRGAPLLGVLTKQHNLETRVRTGVDGAGVDIPPYTALLLATRPDTRYVNCFGACSIGRNHCPRKWSTDGSHILRLWRYKPILLQLCISSSETMLFVVDVAAGSRSSNIFLCAPLNFRTAQ